jgi:hypothetical protein
MNETPQHTPISLLYLARLAALFLLPVLALLAGVIHLGQEIGTFQKRMRPDGVTQQVSRLEPLRAAVGSEVNIGYVGDGVNTAGPWPPPNRNAVMHFYLAQYTLAPAVLHIPSDAPLVVGYFNTRALAQQFAKNHAGTLRVLLEGRAGALLFQRGAP